ncbi:MAG TPA: ATP-dependent sacrificial sulfur transferase LarE [Terriglobales bacterium]|nr:ATP-dependent sacrificial sulfur transferase LarE [Terriglobales bacterium]
MSAFPAQSLTSNLDRKEHALRARLASLGSVLVAYSGGTDSAFLAWSAHEVLGERMLAVLADSPSLPRRELRLAIEFAEHWHIPLKVIVTQEMDRPEYTRNDSGRCFHCKDELFTVMEQERNDLDFQYIVYGKNLDDQGDFRPGQRAAEDHHVLSPLAEAGLTKQEIRSLAERAGLTVWNKPASACLSSRIEYGRSVTREALAAIEAGEDALRELGFQQARVRHHGEIVRIEIAREELARAFTPEMTARLVPIFKKLGFKYVTLDCEGYRSGSMNAVLPIEQIRMAN